MFELVLFFALREWRVSISNSNQHLCSTSTLSLCKTTASPLPHPSHKPIQKCSSLQKTFQTFQTQTKPSWTLQRTTKASNPAQQPQHGKKNWNSGTNTKNLWNEEAPSTTQQQEVHRTNCTQNITVRPLFLPPAPTTHLPNLNLLPNLLLLLPPNYRGESTPAKHNCGSNTNIECTKETGEKSLPSQ